MVAEGSDIHRTSEVTRVTRILDEPEEGLSIVAISGAGGVGKTFLVNHVLEMSVPETSGYMVLRSDASNAQARSDFFGLVEGQLFRRSIPRPADPRKDYFPKLREVAAIHRALVEAAASEMDKESVPPDVKRVAMSLLAAGRFVNKIMPVTGLYLDATSIRETDIAKAANVATAVLSGLKVFRESTKMPGPLRDLLGVTRRNRVRRDLFALTAEEIRADLSAALVGWERKDVARISHPRIAGLDKLLIVLDDYEATQAVMGDFLVGALVPELASAPFQTVLVIVGRDDLESTHPGWSQHARKFMRDQIRLQPFDERTATDLFASSGIPEERWDGLYEATQGYPFLLSLVIEEAAEYRTGSVVFLRRFYDRTTRWMTEEEREWFVLLCYLDKVNEDTLAALFPADAVPVIQDWFEKEPSVRDPTAPYFRVRPLIRDKMLRYQEIRAPKRHRELLAIAKSVETEERTRPSLVGLGSARESTA